MLIVLFRSYVASLCSCGELMFVAVLNSGWMSSCVLVCLLFRVAVSCGDRERMGTRVGKSLLYELKKAEFKRLRYVPPLLDLISSLVSHKRESPSLIAR